LAFVMPDADRLAWLLEWEGGAVADKPTLRRRELGRLLRRLREDAGLTAEDAGRHVDLSGPTMSRVERGTTRVKPLVLNALLVLYGAAEEMQETARALAGQAQQRGWWQDLGALPPGLGGYVGLEADASTLRTYDTHLIHGGSTCRRCRA
jgi:transcriptional regulator with XRE-family HTH domain